MHINYEFTPTNLNMLDLAVKYLSKLNGVQAVGKVFKPELSYLGVSLDCDQSEQDSILHQLNNLDKALTTNYNVYTVL